MSMATTYSDRPPTRVELDRSSGPVLLEFGANWCGICRSLQPVIAKALREHPDVRHIKVADGPGQALGRSFGVKLWPTLIALRDGRELARVVRPMTAIPVAKALASITAEPAAPGPGA